MRRILMAFVVLVCVNFAGCKTIMGSASGKLPAGGGSAYSLPKGLLNVQLSDMNGTLVISITGPEYVPDERHTYLLQYMPNPFSSDTAELTIDPKTNLLQTINGTAEDKTSQVIIQLARAAAMFAQAAKGEEAEIVIFERKFDPAADDAVLTAFESEMNNIAASHAVAMYDKSCHGGMTQSKADRKMSNKCLSYARSRKGGISFKVTRPAPLESAAADCSLGVCYRVPAPYGIEFTFNGEYSYGTVVNLPNNRPAFVLPLDRTPFVKRVDNAEFENGMLKKAHFEKPSEALEVASLPVSVMTAVFDSIATLVQARINISDKEKGLAESQTALLQAEKDLQTKRTEIAQGAAKDASPVLLWRSIAKKVPGIMNQQSQSTESAKFPMSQGNPGSLKPEGR